MDFIISIDCHQSDIQHPPCEGVTWIDGAWHISFTGLSDFMDFIGGEGDGWRVYRFEGQGYITYEAY
jgi:hypothetical protein